MDIRPAIDSIPVDDMPDSLPLQRAIGRQFNDPNLLEEQDFIDFSNLVQDRYNNGDSLRLYSMILAAYIDENFNPKRGSVDQHRLFEASYEAMKYVNNLGAGSDLDGLIIDDDEIEILSAVFGDETYSIVEDMVRNYEDLKNSCPYVFTETEKFQDNEDFNSFAALANSLVTVTIKEYNREYKMSVPIPKLPFGAILMSDSRGTEFEEAELEWGSPPKALFHTRSLGSIFFSAEAMMLSGDESTVMHELNHLWLYLRLGYRTDHRNVFEENFAEARYLEMPKWFREGLAVVSAEQTYNKMVIALTHKSPDALIKQFDVIKEEAPEYGRDYYAMAVAIDSLMALYGKSIIASIINTTAQINPYQAFGDLFRQSLVRTIPEWSGLDEFYNKLEERMKEVMAASHTERERRAYIDVLKTLFPEAEEYYNSSDPEQSPYAKVIDIINWRADADQLNNFEEECSNFLDVYPESPFSFPIKYALALSYHKMGNVELASKYFNEIIDDPAPFYIKAEYSLFHEAVGRAIFGEEGAKAIEEIFPYLLNPDLRYRATELIKSLKDPNNFVNDDDQTVGSPENESANESGCECSVRSSNKGVFGNLISFLIMHTGRR